MFLLGLLGSLCDRIPRVDTQGRKGGSDSTLEFCGFLVLLFGNHARVLGLGLVESIVVSE